MSQLTFCPACGAGIGSESEHGMTVRLPHEFPFEQPCEVCKERDAARMREAGEQIARRQEEAVMRAVFGGAK